MTRNRYYYEFDGDFYKFIVAEETRDGEVLSKKVLSTCKQIAICFDLEDSVLLKHGEVKFVREQAIIKRKKLMQAGCTDWASKLHVLEFPVGFDIEEINKCIEITGYIGVLFKKFDTN